MDRPRAKATDRLVAITFWRHAADSHCQNISVTTGFELLFHYLRDVNSKDVPRYCPRDTHVPAEAHTHTHTHTHTRTPEIITTRKQHAMPYAFMLAYIGVCIQAWA